MNLIEDLKALPLLTSQQGFVYLKGSHHRIKIPRLNNDFAVFLGLMWGDGWLTNRKLAVAKGDWRIGFVEDDRPLIGVFCELTKALFCVHANVRDMKTKCEVYFNSRIIYELLSKSFGFPDGEKIGKLRIPKTINRAFIADFLRGLFSTDGKFGIYKNYPRIGLESATKGLIKDVEVSLKTLGLNPKLYVWNRKGGNKLYGLHLNGKEQTILFYKKVNFVGEKANKLDNYIKSIALKY